MWLVLVAGASLSLLPLLAPVFFFGSCLAVARRRGNKTSNKKLTKFRIRGLCVAHSKVLLKGTYKQDLSKIVNIIETQESSRKHFFLISFGLMR